MTAFHTDQTTRVLELEARLKAAHRRIEDAQRTGDTTKIAEANAAYEAVYRELQKVVGDGR